MKVVFTREAEYGLERIGDYIAQDNPRRSLSFIAALRPAALELANFPSAYPLVLRYGRLGVRRRVHGDYLIFFRIEADAVVILHFIHGAQDYGRFLEDGD